MRYLNELGQKGRISGIVMAKISESLIKVLRQNQLSNFKSLQNLMDTHPFCGTQLNRPTTIQAGKALVHHWFDVEEHAENNWASNRLDDLEGYGWK